MHHIAILSQRNDLHGRAIFAALQARGTTKPYYIATDSFLSHGELRWRPGAKPHAAMQDFFGTYVDITSLAAVWWRRVNQPSIGTEELADEVTIDLVESEWRASLQGAFLDSFQGCWINYPWFDVYAGNKITQLRAASTQGFRIPRTLVSNNPAEIRQFCDDLGGYVIIKKLVGTPLRPLATLLLSRQDLLSNDAITLCPSMYQERVVTNRHIRVCCFGDRVLAALIKSDVLDWRRDLSVPFEAFKLGTDVEKRLVQLVRSLGLRMGIMDMMIDCHDELVWLELNTQGQFLFIEGKCGLDVTGAFVDFLLEEARASESGSSAANVAMAVDPRVMT